MSVSESGGRAAVAKGLQIYMIHYEVHEICSRIMGKFIFFPCENSSACQQIHHKLKESLFFRSNLLLNV